MYPDPPPMWFSESEDSTVSDIVEAVNKVRTSSSRLLLGMTRYLVKELLKSINKPVPQYVENLEDGEVMQVIVFCCLVFFMKCTVSLPKS